MDKEGKGNSTPSPPGPSQRRNCSRPFFTMKSDFHGRNRKRMSGLPSQSPRITRGNGILPPASPPYPERLGREGALTAEGAVPNPRRWTSTRTEEPPETLASTPPFICPLPPGPPGSRGRRLTARPDRARLCRGGSSNTETGQDWGGHRY